MLVELETPSLGMPGSHFSHGLMAKPNPDPVSVVNLIDDSNCAIHGNNTDLWSEKSNKS